MVSVGPFVAAKIVCPAAETPFHSFGVKLTGNVREKISVSNGENVVRATLQIENIIENALEYRHVEVSEIWKDRRFQIAHNGSLSTNRRDPTVGNSKQAAPIAESESARSEFEQTVSRSNKSGQKFRASVPIRIEISGLSPSLAVGAAKIRK